MSIEHNPIQNELMLNENQMQLFTIWMSSNLYSGTPSCKWIAPSRIPSFPLLSGPLFMIPISTILAERRCSHLT